MSSRRAIFLILAVLLIGAPATATAHSAPSAPMCVGCAASPADALSSVMNPGAPKGAASMGPHGELLLLAGVAVAFWCSGSRRLRPVGLSLVLIVGGYEGAIHSVHHLGDTNAAAHCRVASSHEHVNVIDVEVPRLASAMPAARPDPIPVPPSPARIVALAPDVGRAPPV